MRVSLPDGKVAEFPDAMPPKEIEAAIAREFPTKEGQPQKVQNVEFPTITGNIKKLASPENLIPLAANLIPGEGALMGLARPAISALGVGGVTGDIGKAATAGISSLAGQVAGGLARAGTRSIASMLDRTMKNVSKAIGEAVPAFGGKSPAETFNRIIGGEGMKGVQKEFGDTMKRLWEKNVPGAPFPTGEVTPEFREMFKHLAKTWPAEDQQALQDMNRRYFVAEKIQTWAENAFKGGLMPRTGKLDPAALQEALIPSRAMLKNVLPGIEKTLRMPIGSAQIDQPAKGVLQSIGGHASPYGMHAYLRHLPSAPRMAQEGIAPGLAAQTARFLGTGGTELALGQ